MSTRVRLGVAMAIVLLLVGAGTLGTLIWPLDPHAPSEEASLAPPSSQHPLGADLSGRDVLARVLAGARTSLLVACLAVLLATTLGSLVGLASGMGGRVADAVLMRTVDFFNAFPQVLLVIFLASLLAGGSFLIVVLVLAFTTWMGTARLVRAEVLSLKERDFITSARASGAGAFRLACRHLLPNLGAVILVTATLRVGNAILLETSLGFLGLGVPAETPSWGRMVHEGYLVMREAWWIAAFPGLAITLATVGFNLLGDGLRDRLDPRRR